jgi:hypothetical protein
VANFDPMTLTMTIVTERVASQCADYRLQDVQSERLFDSGRPLDEVVADLIAIASRPMTTS